MADKEYVERKELLKDIEEERPVNWTDSESERQAESDFYKYRDIVMMQPTADVVEAVRCKDCKRFLQMETSPSYDGKCLGYGYLVEANHFCSYGEKKEGVNE